MRIQFLTFTTAVFGMLLGLCGDINAADWAQWRGPEMMGISREKGLIDEWSLGDKKNVLWESPIGGRATPVVLNGKIYLNSRTTHNVNKPEKIHSRSQVVCRDVKTGEVLWQDFINVFQTDIAAPRVGWASMAGDTETGNVYVHTVSGLFRCYSGDGEKLWEYALRPDFGLINGYGGRTQTPIIDEDRVIVSFLCMNWGDTAKPPPKQTYYAFDKKSGELLWTAAPGGRPFDTNYSCPVVTVINGTRMLIGGNSDGGIHAFNARTGEKIWGFRMSKRGLNASTVVDGDLVYISHGEDNIDSTDFGRIQCIDATGKGDVTDTHSIWRVDNIKAGYASLLVKDGILYVVSDTGKLYAFDSKDGTQLWVHNLGTVGKGSPAWADGKLYVMEVNGNVHILKPSREKCESLSHVQIPSANGEGMDEIYASPAIADGRVFVVTRDRTFCLGTPDHEVQSDPIPPLAEETPATDKIAHLQLIPYETKLMGSGEVDYTVKAFDANGHFIKNVEAEISLVDELPGTSVSGAKLTLDQPKYAAGGKVKASFEGLEAVARIRVFPSLPWNFGFDNSSGGSPVPVTWINAFGKVKPAELEGNPVASFKVPKGRPSAMVWMGPSELTNYTVSGDVYLTEQKRKIASVGLTANRYNLILKGNNYKLAIQSWAPHLRMAKQQKFRVDTDSWYTMKLSVDIKEGEATVRGKVWKRDEEEPAEWTIEAVDPHANENGSPGLYVYSLADAFIDNIQVTENKE